MRSERHPLPNSAYAGRQDSAVGQALWLVARVCNVILVPAGKQAFAVRRVLSGGALPNTSYLCRLARVSHIMSAISGRLAFDFGS